MIHRRRVERIEKRDTSIIVKFDGYYASSDK